MRALRSTLAVTALAAALVGASQVSALADSSAITVNYATTDSTSIGKIDVSASATSAITKITAALVNQSTGQTVAIVSDFTLTSGTTTAWIWETAARVQIASLGYYRIDLTVTDTAGDVFSSAGTGSGYFDYQNWTSFRDVKLSSTTVDYADRQVTMTGQLLAQSPQTGKITPFADAPVYINTPSGEDTTPVTDANGDFTAIETITQAGQLQALYTYQNSLLNYIGSASKTFAVSIKPAVTKIVFALSSRKIPFGGTYSGSGTLLWDSPTAGWQPLANDTIGSYSCGDDFQVQTDADGNFLIPQSDALNDGCTFTMGWYSTDPYLASATAQATITVIQPAAFSGFSATRAAADVNVTGHLQYANDVPATPTAEIQYSATGKGGWTTVATGLQANWDGTGYAFSDTIASTSAGFWRAISSYPDFVNATSTVVYVGANS
jgi:hypothetical protein